MMQSVGVKITRFALACATFLMVCASAGADTLTIGHSTEIRSLDPRVTPTSADEFILYNVFDPLLNYDQDGNIVPGLVSRWEISPDMKSYTLYLRNDVKFHDGTPFNAEAVKFTFDSIVDPKLGSLAAIDSLGPYEKTEVIDEFTARVSFKTPFSPFLSNATTVRLAPVSPTAVKKMGDARFSEAPVGTGPYKFESWDVRDSVVLVRNDDYNWAPKIFKRQGPAEFDHITFKILEDAFTRVSALESGEVQMIIQAPASEVQRLKDSGYQIMWRESPGLTRQYFINTANPPTDDLAVRQAINYAVDRKEISERIYFGVNTVAYGPLAPTTLGYWPGVETKYPFDPDKARSLLDEAGWKVGSDGIRERNGQKLTLRELTRKEYEQDSVLIQSQLRDVGIDWQINLVTTPARNTNIMENNYNVVWGFWNTLDPDIMRNMFATRSIPKKDAFGYSWSRFNDPKLDELLDAGVTVAADKRVPIYQELQKLITDKALTLPVLNTIQVVAYESKLKGLRFLHDPFIVSLYEATFAKRP